MKLKRIENRKDALEPKKTPQGRKTLAEGLAVLGVIGFATFAQAEPRDTVQDTVRINVVEMPTDRFRDSEGRERVRFTAEEVLVRQANGKVSELGQYENAHGRLEITYYWLMYQNPGEGVQYLYNPRHTPSGKQPRYIGQVMRDITCTDGTRGDFVVRIRPSGLDPSEGPQFVPIVEGDGRVTPRNVLFQLESGTLEPVKSGRMGEQLNEVLQDVAQERGRVTHCVNYAPTTAVVIPHLSRSKRSE